MPWVLAAAAVTVGGTLLASNNQANAAESAANQQSAAAAAAQAENAREFDTINANNAPARNLGNAAMSAVGAGFGLSGYGAPTMTGAPRYASTPVPGAGGVSMTGASPDYASTDYGPGMGHNGGPPIGAEDPAVWDAYLADPHNADVLAWAQAGGGDPSIPIGQQSLEQRAAYQFHNTGQSEGRTLPAVSMTGPAASADGGYVAPPGYSDPTAPSGYDPGTRPTVAAAPGRPSMTALNVGLDAYQRSPDYNFRLGEGNKALDHVASQMGGLMSGARLKAADRYNQDYATTDYNQWRDYTTNQYNNDRSQNNLTYSQDLGQYDADRARSDGLFADDRSYDAGRYDTRNTQLLNLAGFGQNATNATNAAGQTFAQNQGALTMTAANAQAGGTIGAANAYSSGINNLATTGAYLGGRYMTNGFSSGYGVTPPVSWAPGETDMTGLY